MTFLVTCLCLCLGQKAFLLLRVKRDTFVCYARQSQRQRSFVKGLLYKLGGSLLFGSKDCKLPSLGNPHFRLLVWQGEEGQYFYVVCEGLFDVLVNTGSGPMVLCTYSAGDHANSAFGELALATGRPQAAEIVARTEGGLFTCFAFALWLLG